MISDNQLLQELRDLFIKLGHLPKRKDMEKFGKSSETTYMNRFSFWSQACEKANLKPLGYDKITPEQLLNELVRIKVKLGKYPTIEDIDQYGIHPYSLYSRSFSGLKNALKQVFLYDAKLF